VRVQVSLQSVESELQQVRDSSNHQKKRIVDMMTNLMKDLADIGTSIGSEFKVRCRLVRRQFVQNVLFIVQRVIKYSVVIVTGCEIVVHLSFDVTIHFMPLPLLGNAGGVVFVVSLSLCSFIHDVVFAEYLCMH